MKHLKLKLALIILIGGLSAIIALPREDAILRMVGLDNVKLGIQQGLDLRGGAQLVFQADFSDVAENQRDSAMQSLITVINRRANIGGTTELTVQRQGSDRVIVSLPGVKDTGEAIDRIGRTANLEFVEVSADGQTQTPTGIDGSDVQQATADYDPTRAQPVVRLQLKGGESTKKFGDLTTKLSTNGNYLLTLLDGQPTFGPATTEPITDGVAILSGNLTLEQARSTAQEITAGALPVPISLVAQSSIGPTLGAESVSRSVVAGLIGLGIVALFMLLYYRLAGVIAVVALIIYTLITVTLYKLSVFVPGYTIVLTLAGIAGFILSIGMAVDANILVFERLKEELRSGRSYVAALEASFARAWTSIRDSNVSTIITCIILYAASGSTPIIRGFAVTLGLGVLISLFTAIVVTRTLMRFIGRYEWAQKPSFYGIKPKEKV